MLFAVYVGDINTLTIWNRKPFREDLFKHLNCFDNEALLYHIKYGEEHFEKWIEFFFPESKYGDVENQNVIRPISEETFDRFIAGEYDKVEETMKRTITVVFERKRGSKDWGQKEYTYYCDDLSVEVGDIIDSPNYDNRVKVIRLEASSNPDYKEVIPISKVYKPEKPVVTKQKVGQTNSENMKKNSMVQGMIDKMKSQFIPQKEDGVKLSMDGALCVQVNDEYVGINKEGTLVSYPTEMCIDAPVYSIAKPTKDIKEGDIIKRKNSFAKVLSVNKDGSLRCLTYSGYVSNKKEIQDFVLNQSVERVLINMFNFDNNLDFNPMIFALMDDNEGLDIKGLMMMQMMQNQNGGNANMFGNMNPMMLMMLSKDGDSSMTDMILMSMCMGRTNPFAAQ